MTSRSVFSLVVILTLFVPNSHEQNHPKKIDIGYVDVGNMQIVVIRVPAGTFAMGSPLVVRADDGWKPCESCPVRNDVERPVHQVTITRDFWMGEFPVTQGQWQAIMANNPSYFRELGPDAPVESVNFRDVQARQGECDAEAMDRAPADRGGVGIRGAGWYDRRNLRAA